MAWVAPYGWVPTANQVPRLSLFARLRTPAASKGLTYFFKALRRIEHPCARLPGWLVAQVLGMPAGQLGNPVQVFVLVEANDEGCR
ncbi:hypothetical protein ATI14_2307 [Pseudomonas tolaasii NCPPB 2192]|uniref:Uncharacterized protein n=1 Tax=Pseudomonas tolaasii NCPPB 2192 TaxID=564423 RepID=A0ABX4QF65_PSETO|nr:hypothetical protein ATI14_2307 [Pseudomonas tolaasii NCPPB 2192]